MNRVPKIKIYTSVCNSGILCTFAALNSKGMKKLKKTPRYVTEMIHTERVKSTVPIGRSEVTDADIEYVQSILKEDYNFFSQTLSDMLHEEWRDEIPYDDSSVVQHMYYLHHTQAQRWTVEDYLALLYQETALGTVFPIILPKVFEILQYDIKVDSGFYKGDLLNAVLEISPNFWKEHKDLYNTACMLIRNNMETLSKMENSTDKKLLDNATAFLTMNKDYQAI